MTEKKPKRPRDPNQLAKLMVDVAICGEASPEVSPTIERAKKAGQKGGPARANTLTPEQRSEIAAIAAQARWQKG